MSEKPGLTGILETVLYCDSSNEQQTRRFYVEVMGFREMPFDFGYRVGEESRVFLLFNRDTTENQTSPPPHGASGKGHCCFSASAETYDVWKSYLDERGVSWGGEIKWGNGMRSFYFEDPAGNVLEIAEGDFWPQG